jgi:putative hydrolase of the HAD superfamily
MVIVFDLDDTLFDSLTYVYSGFRVVSDYLSPLLYLPAEQIFEELKSELQRDRQQVFDRFLARKGRQTKQLIKKCLSIYRGHKPIIHLFPEADDSLNRLKNYPLYVVTDGNKWVQKNKCMALGLPSRMRGCYYTHAHGVHRAKPSPYCFQLICQLEKVNPSEVVYIGDNPYKDFIGLKPLGFHTIRVLTGPYKEIVLDASHEADLTVATLKEINKCGFS